METFWQRWWIINRLHKFTKIKGGIVWAEENEFVRYIRDIVTNRDALANPTLPIRFPYNLLLEINNDLLVDVKLRNIIQECSDPVDGVNYIIRDENTRGNVLNRYHLRLSSRGREVYSFYYLISEKFFGNAYVKAIAIGIIMILVGYYINDHIIHVNSSMPVRETISAQG